MIPIPTYDTVVAAALSFARNRFNGRDLSTESFLGKLSRAEAMLFFQLMQTMLAADNDAVPTSKSSTAALDSWAVAVGVPGSTLGTYGRKLATPALGIAGTISGTNGTVYPDSSTLTASDGQTLYKLNNGGVALVLPGSPPGTSTTTATFDALTGGTIGNLTVNSTLTWSNPPSGSDSTVTVTATPTTP
ncbi:MAG: hypothetical protein JWM53_6430, partial [bacterium]|nr:hypothetical protein [bacterium]